MISDSRMLKVFLSVGSTYTPEQEQFVKALEGFLLRNSCQPYTIGRGSYSAEQPVLRSRKEIQSCDAAVVMAFARYEIEKGTEFPGAPDVERIDGWRLPTPWNQLEGGMAFSLGLPMLILVEKGMKRQGILSNSGEWFPKEIDLHPTELEKKAFVGMFQDWKRLAEERLLERNAGPKIGGLPLSVILREIGVRAGISLILALGSMLAAAFSAGYWVAQKLGPLL